MIATTGKLAAFQWPLYLSLRFFYDHGTHNWGVAIILFTVAFNLLLLWPRLMSMRSAAKMMRLRPKLETIRKRYSHLKIGDPKRRAMNVEIMSLYEQEGVSAFGSCLPILLQMPLLFGMLSVIRNTTELRHAGWLWLADLSRPDPLHVLPVLIIATMMLTQIVTPSPGIDRAQRRILALVMAVTFGFTLWKFASGLALYWATGNLVNLMIQLAINHSRLGQEMRAADSAT